MAHETMPIDISAIPELVQLVDEVQRTGQPRVLRRADEDVALLTPMTPGAKKPRRRWRVLREDDPLFGLVGIGRSGGPGDVAANKHRYLADAIRAESRRDPGP